MNLKRKTLAWVALASAFSKAAIAWGPPPGMPVLEVPTPTPDPETRYGGDANLRPLVLGTFRSSISTTPCQERSRGSASEVDGEGLQRVVEV